MDARLGMLKASSTTAPDFNPGLRCIKKDIGLYARLGMLKALSTTASDFNPGLRAIDRNAS